MRPSRGIYEVTDALVDWMSETLLPVEESTFVHFRQIYKLVELVQAAESGRVPRFAALSAIRDHNSEAGTSINYDEIKNLDSTYILSDYGQWVAFTDQPNAIILGEHDQAEDALEYAPDTVEIIVVWDTSEDQVIVYRSPYVANREPAEIGAELGYSKGWVKGNEPTYVLPPEIEAALYSLPYGELLRRA